MKIIDRINRKIKLYVRRKINHKVAYEFSPTANGWKKYENPLIGGKGKGTYYDPFVRKIDDKYVMIVSHRDSKDIIRYDSTDGINWNDSAVILKHDKYPVCRASFVKKNNIWYLWYTVLAEKYEIAFAISNDGYHFENCESNPVIVPTLLLEKNAVMNPCVMFDDGIFKMWYAAGDKFEPDVLFYAESVDGINWEKENAPILAKSKHKYDCNKVGGCDVIKQNNRYLMFYIGYQNIDTARICKATSLDGKKWERCADNPIISPSRNTFDSDSVYKPTIVLEGDKELLWYNGRNNHVEVIGFAYKEGK